MLFPQNKLRPSSCGCPVRTIEGVFPQFCSSSTAPTELIDRTTGDVALPDTLDNSRVGVGVGRTFARFEIGGTKHAISTTAVAC
jgi:hypothetical protein